MRRRQDATPRRATEGPQSVTAGNTSMLPAITDETAATRAASLLAEAWAGSHSQMYGHGYRDGYRHGHRVGGDRAWSQFSAAITGVYDVMSQPQRDELDARREMNNDPCSTPVVCRGRCSRCVRAASVKRRLAAGGSVDFPGRVTG